MSDPQQAASEGATAASEGTTAASEGATAASEGATARPQFGRWMGTMWLYTVLRFGLFFVLWGVVLLFGVEPLLAGLLALLLSVPLSFVLLATPRRAFTMQLEARVEAQRRRRDDLAVQLDPEQHETER